MLLFHSTWLSFPFLFSFGGGHERGRASLEEETIAPKRMRISGCVWGLGRRVHSSMDVWMTETAALTRTSELQQAHTPPRRRCIHHR
jgi:hypothetical protein